MENIPSVEDWQLTMTKMNERLHHVLTSKQLSDCVFTVGTDSNKLFNAHKLLLAMASPVFQAMFYGGMAEKENPIRILDIEPEAFQAVLEYIYTDNTNIETFDLACAVMYAAKKYMLPGLVEKCKETIFQDLSTGNACQAYEFSMQHDEPQLAERSLQFMMSNTEAVVADSRLEEVELATLLLILDTPCITSEVDLFDAVLKWARKECARKGLPEDSTNLRHVVGPALEKIHFLALTPSQFAKGPAEAPLLTKDEILSILMKLSNPSLPMPRGFSMGLCRCQICRQGGRPKEDCIQGKSLQIVEMNCGDLTFFEAASTSTLYFSVDQDITVFGVKVRTPKLQCSNQNTYDEMFNISIGQKRGQFQLISAISYIFMHNSELLINFNNSFHVKKNEECTVNVILNLRGFYPCSMNTEERFNCDGVTFLGHYMPHPCIVSGIKFCRST